MPIPQTASICLLHVGAYNISHFYKPLCSFPLRSSQTFLFSEADINSTPSIISKSRTTITAPPNLEVLPTSTSTSTFHFSTCPPQPISQILTSPSPHPHPSTPHTLKIFPRRNPSSQRLPPKKRKTPKNRKNATKKSQLHHRQRQQTRRSPNDSLVDSCTTHIAECGFGRNSRDD